MTGDAVVSAVRRGKPALSGAWDAIVLIPGVALLRLVGFAAGEVLAAGGVGAGGLVLFYALEAWPPLPSSRRRRVPDARSAPLPAGAMGPATPVPGDAAAAVLRNLAR